MLLTALLCCASFAFGIMATRHRYDRELWYYRNCAATMWIEANRWKAAAERLSEELGSVDESEAWKFR